MKHFDDRRLGGEAWDIRSVLEHLTTLGKFLRGKNLEDAISEAHVLILREFDNRTVKPKSN